MLAILMLSACKTSTKIVEVPVEVVKKEYVHDTKIDSVYIRDSVDRRQKGDTLYITKWHTKYKYINKVDTVVKTDSILKIVPIVKEVEVNHIYWWQKTLMWSGTKLLDVFGYDGNSVRKGDSANRPNMDATQDGYQYYDTTLKKYIVWNGTEWTNMDGTNLIWKSFE